jgi:glycosyltransferase involved in cell wall biosynthesis
MRVLKLFLRQRRYAAVVCVFEGSAAGPATLKKAGLLRRPLLLWDFTPESDWRVKKLLQQLIFPNADAVLCLNSCQARIANREARAEKAICIGYNVDTDFFRPEYSCDGTYALALGKDVSRDYRTLIDAVQVYPIALKVCTPLRLELPDKGAAKISLLSEWLSYAQLRQMYGNAKFVILPLRDVPHPGGITTLAEAMSMGKAIICSDSAGIRDFIRHGENAIVVPVGDRAALAEAIRFLDTNPGERKRLGGNAREYAEGTCAGPVVARNMLSALRHVVGSAGERDCQ